MRSLLFALLLFLPTLARGAAVCPCPCPQLDDQSCYETPRHNTFRPPIPVTIVDQFGTLTANAVNFHRLCAPTNKNDDCPTCPTQPDHYLGLELDHIVGTPAQPHVSVAYQFGVISGDVGAPGFLQVPAGKSLTKPAPRACGAPWKREIKQGALVPTKLHYDKRAYGVVVAHPDQGDQGRNRARDGHRAGMAYERHDRGWAPTCACDAAVVPCTVLDPFGGSGTVGEVAEQLGRHSVLIELSTDYVRMAEERTAQCGLFTQRATHA